MVGVCFMCHSNHSDDHSKVDRERGELGKLNMIIRLLCFIESLLHHESTDRKKQIIAFLSPNFFIVFFTIDNLPFCYLNLIMKEASPQYLLFPSARPLLSPHRAQVWSDPPEL